MSTNQFWRPVYGPYREAAFLGITEAERLKVTAEYEKDVNAFSKACRENPINGLTLSRIAKAQDESASWRRKFSGGLSKHDAALLLLPTLVEVQRNAINGYWRAWQETAGRAEKIR